MKKLITFCAIFCGLLMTQYGYSQDACCNQQPACPSDEQTGDCYCLYRHYVPCYTNEWKCCDEQVPVCRTCTRYVPKYYQCQKCRYVPQYYCETYCRYQPEQYTVQDTKCVKRWYCEKKCNYVPKYYWKHVCGQAPAAQSCGAPAGGCGGGNWDQGSSWNQGSQGQGQSYGFQNYGNIPSSTGAQSSYAKPEGDQGQDQSMDSNR